MLPIVESIILANVGVLVPPKPTGRPRVNSGTLLRHMTLVLESGMSWRQLGRCQLDNVDFRTVHRHFSSWSACGVFRTAYNSLLRLYSRRTRRGEFHCIDSTYVKNIFGIDCVGRNPTDRGRNATKVSAIVNDEGVPLSLVAFPGNTSDYNTVDETIRSCLSTPKRGCPMYADKGYDSARVRDSFRREGYVERVAESGPID